MVKHQVPRDFALFAGAAPGPRPTGLPHGSRCWPWLQFRLPTGFLWTRAALPIAGLGPQLDGLRLLHLSDLHLRNYWGAAYDDLIDRVRTSAPDLILFTGDFIDSKTDHRPVLPILRRLIPHLHSRLGLYAIQGNHDPDLMIPCLAEMGVHWITHRRAVLADGKARLELIGLGGFVRADLDEEFLRALGPKEAGVPRVVMCHYPDLFALARLLEPDIFLAGHTHGGQICLPGGKPLMSHDSMPKRFTAGIHRLGQTWYVVSRGMGFSGIPVRLFCPAETMELTLRAQQ